MARAVEESVNWASPVGLTPCDPAGASVPAFLQWCGKQRVRLPKCCITKSENTGRCVRATAAIAKEEVVVEVPDDAVLMSENCSIADLLEEYGLCKPAEDPILEVQGLIIALMHERNLGSKSRWSPYLDFMPTDMTHLPMYWEADEVSELRGTAALDLMEGLVQQPADAPTRVNELWCEVAEPFVIDNPQLGIPGGEGGLELYRWATAVVSSYSFMLGDDRYQSLVPVWDALNHVTGSANVRLHHVEKRGVLQMIATRDISAGEEVINNYGALSNTELLRAYGYVERLEGGIRAAPPGSSSSSSSSEELRLAGFPNNAHSNVQVPFQFVLEVCRSMEPESKQSQAEPGPSGRDSADEEETEEPRIRFCRRHKLLAPKRVFKLHYGRGPCVSLTEVMRLLLLPESQFEEFSSSITSWQPPMALPLTAGQQPSEESNRAAAEPGGKNKRTPLIKQTEKQASRSTVHQAYLKLIETMTNRYNCSLESDLEILSSSDCLAALQPRLQAAVVARADEKACWAALRAWLEEPDADLKLAQQSRDAWRQALAFSRKTARAYESNAALKEQDMEAEQLQNHLHGKRRPPTELQQNSGSRKCPAPEAAVRPCTKAASTVAASAVTAFSFNFAL